MKTLALVAFIILLCSSLHAQRSIQWQKAYGGAKYDYAYDIKQTPDGGYIVTGYTDSKDGNITGAHDTSEVWVLKTDAVGAITWQKCLGGSSADFGRHIITTKDGGYLLIGETQSVDGDVTSNKGQYDIWLVKLTAAGGITWQRTYGGANDEEAGEVIETTDGGYLFVGHTRSIDGDVTNPKGIYDAWVVKLDVNGNITWEQTYGGPAYDGAQSVKQTIDGGYIVSGFTYSLLGDFGTSYGQNDAFLLKLSASGAIEWQKRYGGSSIESAFNALETPDGYIMCGFTSSNDIDVTGNHGKRDLWVVKTNATGGIVWQKTFGGSEDEFGYDIKRKDDGRYIVTGSTLSADQDATGSNGARDMWILELNADGSIHWNRPVGGSFSDGGLKAAITSDGGYIASGYKSSNDKDASGGISYGTIDVWLVKLAPPVSVDEVKSNNSISIYPTVTNNRVNIATGGDYKNATVRLYNTIGQHLQTVGLTGGKAFIDLEKYSAGVYVIQVTNGNDATSYQVVLQP